MKILYFTATGNSLYVAKSIGENLYSIPQLVKNGEFEIADESIGIVYPCYGFSMPRLVEEFLKKAKLKTGYLFAVMTYGNIAASGLKNLQNAAAYSDLEFDYLNEIVMVDNYLPIFRMEAQVKMDKNIENNLKDIISDIRERKKLKKEKGLLSNGISKIAKGFMAKQYGNCDKKFYTNEKCNQCGVCVTVCPKANIELKERPDFLHKCDYCLSCIHHCPQNAIHLKGEKSSVRFRNANISLKEIIDANNMQETKK